MKASISCILVRQADFPRAVSVELLSVVLLVHRTLGRVRFSKMTDALISQKVVKAADVILSALKLTSVAVGD